MELPQVDLITALGVIGTSMLQSFRRCSGASTRGLPDRLPDFEGRKRNRLMWYLRQVYLRVHTAAPASISTRRTSSPSGRESTVSRRCVLPAVPRSTSPQTCRRREQEDCLPHAGCRGGLRGSGWAHPAVRGRGVAGSVRQAHRTNGRQGHGVSSHLDAGQVRRPVPAAGRAEPCGVRIRSHAHDLRDPCSRADIEAAMDAFRALPAGIPSAIALRSESSRAKVSIRCSIAGSATTRASTRPCDRETGP